MGRRLDDNVSIYALCDPTGVIRYVGKARNPHTRFKQHVREALKERGVNKHKEAWIRDVHANGGEIQLLILEWCNGSAWEDAERKWIAKYARTLTNQAPGGNQPPCSIDTRKANAKRLNEHPERALIMATRVMNTYARTAMKNGNVHLASKLLFAVMGLKESKGEARKRLLVWAMERFKHETEASKAA